MCIALLYVKEERSKGHLPSTPSSYSEIFSKKGMPFSSLGCCHEPVINLTDINPPFAYFFMIFCKKQKLFRPTDL